jgi:formylglycine-generating enzyme required for sulfatase activity
MTDHRRSGCVGVPRIFLALLALVCTLASLHDAKANDVRIRNFWRHSYSGGNGEVEFDVAWDNSWRVATEPFNWDAVWIFARIRINGGDWAPLKLNTTGHTIPAGFTHTMGLVDTGAAHNASTNPAVGVFVYRSSDGFGTSTVADVRLQWSYADNGAASGDNVEIRVMALEMVYIPEAAFYAGDNATSDSAFREKETTDNDPWYINSGNTITTTAGTSGSYYYPGPGEPANSIFTVPAAFPKGFGAFYMMKGELSQGQWVTFFNMLTDTQKATRDITGGVLNSTGKAGDGLVNRNNVSWVSGEATLPDQGGGANYSAVAMNFISWADLTAYLDWAGLRPMSELEYEKAGRGPKVAVSGEYAWGSTNITGATTISNSGLMNERGQSGSNVTYNNPGAVQGPLRVGNFARGANGREAAGGGFYGVLDLSGNVWERAVTVGNNPGRALEGRYHGNGILDTNGNPNVSSWPGINGNGAGFRGGGWYTDSFDARLSRRSIAAYIYTGRAGDLGGRGVRSAP